jgi:hypothetical protein
LHWLSSGEALGWDSRDFNPPASQGAPYIPHRGQNYNIPMAVQASRGQKMAKLSKDDLIDALKNAHAKQAEQAKPLNSQTIKQTFSDKPVTLERLALAIGKTYEQRMKKQR